MKKHTQAEYQHGIAQNILTHFIREHIAGNQPQVIDIEDNEIAQRNTTVPQELGQVKAASRSIKTNGKPNMSSQLTIWMLSSKNVAVKIIVSYRQR